MLRGQKDKTEAIKAYEMSITLVCCVLSFRYAVILKPPLLFLKPPLLILKPPNLLCMCRATASLA
jgi:hypothetical protein